MMIQNSFGPQDTGTLYLVPTPIGNLQDMSPRAIETLQTVDVIAAEDTRNTQKLLTHFDIHTPQISFHQFNTAQRIPQLLDQLRQGQSIAQVSDAGMPAISDPGQELVTAATAAGIPVVAIPGPNAALTALIASSIASQPFAFYGFIPRKEQAQLTFWQERVALPLTTIYYESPQRIGTTLARLMTVFPHERPVVIARELTKRYEAYVRGTLATVTEAVAEHPLRGELVMIIGPAVPEQVVWTESAVRERALALVASGTKPTAVAKTVAQASGWDRHVVYDMILKEQRSK